MPDFRSSHIILDGLQYTVTKRAFTSMSGEERDVRELSRKTRARIRHNVQRLIVTWESLPCQVRASTGAHTPHGNCHERDRSGAK